MPGTNASPGAELALVLPESLSSHEDRSDLQPDPPHHTTPRARRHHSHYGRRPAAVPHRVSCGLGRWWLAPVREVAGRVPLRACADSGIGQPTHGAEHGRRQRHLGQSAAGIWRTPQGVS